MGPLLAAKSITKAYAGVEALKSASFDLFEGEVHALIGENGAGKSTLIKVMTGAVQADSGTLVMAGRAFSHVDPVAARALGIAAIYQQPSLFPHLTVAENIGLALEDRSVWRRVNWRERTQRATELIERVGGSIRPDRLASSLRMAEQQLVEIAKALGAKAKVLIMDEPTASLSDREVERLFAVVGSLRRDRVGIIYISHRLEEIFSIADRITVLRDGETVATVQTRETDREQLIRMMAGREIDAALNRSSAVGAVSDRPFFLESTKDGRSETAPTEAETVLEVRHLENRAAGLRDISFALKAGEILGLAGLVGSGRTELAETLFGLTPADSGEIVMRGKPVRFTSPADAIRLGIGYVPEDRRQHGVVLEMPVAANASLANLKAVSRRGLLQTSLERELAERYIERLRIRTSSVNVEAGTLSGGNQQKVALARWLAIDPAVLILDEPTQGVDVASKTEIHRLIAELAERGLAIIMISSELPEVLAMSDRIAVMHAGAIRGILLRDEATQEKILSLALEDRIA
jgi:rhamnose transport system ATP-binding protein